MELRTVAVVVDPQWSAPPLAVAVLLAKVLLVIAFELLLRTASPPPFFVAEFSTIRLLIMVVP